MKPGPRRRVTCRRCNRDGLAEQARGLCSMCFDHLRNRGELDQYPAHKPDTQGAVRPLYEQGKTAAEIATELGITRNAAWCAIRALREKGVFPMTGYRYESANSLSFWARLHVPAPDADPECKGQHHLTDIPSDEVRHFMRNGRPSTFAQMQTRVALAMCARCPVRDWCETEATQPHVSKASIIAGGKVFINGEVVWDIARQEAMEAEQDEMYGVAS